MRREILFCCILFLLIPLVHGAIVLDSTVSVTDGSSISPIYDETVFRLTISGHNNGEKIALKTDVPGENGTTNSFFLWLDLTECKIYHYTRFCFISSSNTSGVWTASIERWDLSPDVSFTFSVDKTTEIYLGEDFTLTTKVENKGEFEAQNLTIDIKKIEHLEPLSTGGFYSNDTHFFLYYDELDADESFTNDLDFKLQTNGSIVIEAELNYVDFFGAPGTITQSVTMNLTDYFNYSFFLSPDTISVDGSTNFSGFLQNNLTTPIVNMTKFEITFPPLLRLGDYFRVSHSKENVLSYRKEFSYNISRVPLVEFFGEIPGTSNVTVYMEYGLSTETDVDSRITVDLPITVTGKLPNLTSSLPSTGEYDSGEEIDLELMFENPYSLTTLTVDSITLIVNGEKKHYPASINIPPLTEKSIVNSTFRLPNVNDDKEISIDTIVTYGAQGFPIENLSTNSTLLVTSDKFELDLRVEPKQLVGGDSATVTVTLKNPTLRTLSGVHVYDVTEFISTTNASKTLDIGPGEIVEVYAYEIVAPFVTEPLNLTHATLVEFTRGDRERVYLNQTVISITPPPEDTSEKSLPFAPTSSTQQEENTSTTLVIAPDEPVVQEESFFSVSNPYMWLIIVVLLLVFGIGGFLLVRRFSDDAEEVSVVSAESEKLQSEGLQGDLSEVTSAVQKATEMPGKKTEEKPEKKEEQKGEQKDEQKDNKEKDVKEESKEEPQKESQEGQEESQKEVKTDVDGTEKSEEKNEEPVPKEEETTTEEKPEEKQKSPGEKTQSVDPPAEEKKDAPDSQAEPTESQTSSEKPAEEQQETPPAEEKTGASADTSAEKPKDTKTENPGE